MATTETAEAKTAETKTQRPRLDLRAMLEKLELPGVDTRQLVEARRKDIEAILDANDHAFAAVDQLTHKQADLLAAMLQEWQANARDAIAPTRSGEKLGQAAQHLQHAFTTALASMRDMAEIAARGNRDVLGILNKRYHEGLEEFRTGLRKALPRAADAAGNAVARTADKAANAVETAGDKAARAADKVADKA